MEAQNVNLETMEQMFQQLSDTEKEIFLFCHADEAIRSEVDALGELSSEERLEVINEKGLGGPREFVEAVFGKETVNDWLEDEILCQFAV